MVLEELENRFPTEYEKFRRVEEELKMRARQQEVVAELGQRALQGTELPIMMDLSAQVVAATLGVEYCEVLKLLPGGKQLLLVAGVGWKEGLVGNARVSAGVESQGGYTLLASEPIIVEDLQTETRFTGSPLLKDHGAVSGISVIIHGHEQAFGVLGAHTIRYRAFTRDDIHFLQSVANVLGSAIERARSEEVLQLSRDQLEIILEGVADGITVQDKRGNLVYANRAAARLMGYPSAQAALAAPLQEIMSKFELLDEDGSPFPLEKLPGRRVLAGEPGAEALIRFRIKESGEERWSSVRSRPVLKEAGKAELAINIFQDVTGMVWAEQAQRFLSEASRLLLATGLDIRERLATLANLVVPQLADWCSISLYDEQSDSLNNLVLAHADPEKFDLAEVILRRYPPDMHAETGVAQVIRSGRTDFIPQVSDEMLVAAARDEEHLALLRQLGLKSAMVVPLVAGDRTLGAVTLVWAGSGRIYTPEDVQLVEEIAARAGLAIDHARLYQEAQTLNEQLGARASRRTAQLRAMINRLKDEVAERKRAEESALASQGMLNTIFESAPDAKVIVDQAGAIVRLNAQVEALFGYTRAELIGESVEMLLPERFREDHTRHRRAYFAKPVLRPMGMGLDLYGRRKDGSDFPVNIMLSPVETEAGTLVIAAVRDISDRKQAEEAVRQRDALLRAAVTGAPIALFVTDREGVIRLSMGENLKRSWYRGQITGRRIDQVYRDVPTVREYIQRALQGESFNAVIEMAGLAFEVQYAPLRDDLGEVSGVVSVATDITDRKRAEDALRKSEARFRTIFQEAPIGISIMDLQGNWLDTNPAVEQMLGYSKEELGDMQVADVSIPEQARQDMRLLKDLVAGKRDHYTMEKLYRCKDGKLAWGHLTVSLVRDEQANPEFAIALVEDVTDRKQLQAELEELGRRLLESAEGERLSLAQELHDGPVQELHGATYQLQSLSTILSDGDSQAELGGVRNSIQEVIRELRAICRELRPPTLTPFGLEKAILSHSEHFLEAHPHVDLRLELMEDGQQLPEGVRLALFRIYQQALNNVVRHADAKVVQVRFSLDAEHAILEVEDDGRGFQLPRRWIDMAREGHLGLVGSFERAQAIGGKLQVQSAPGEGTLIRAQVPLG